jgi:hypothetical protein
MNLGLPDREWWTVAPPLRRKEEGEEPTRWLQDAPNNLDVFGTPRRIDRAEAGVLPDAIEEGRITCGQLEDVKLFEVHDTITRPGQTTGRFDSGSGKVEPPGLIPMLSEQVGIVASAAAQDGHPTEGRRLAS